MLTLKVENEDNNSVTLIVRNPKTGKFDSFTVSLSEEGETFHVLFSRFDPEQNRMVGLAKYRQLIDGLGE